MKLHLQFLSKFIFVLLILPATTFYSYATTQIVIVQSYIFTPSSFNLALGDTINFKWLNGSHTTTSTSIPGGAVPWDQVVSGGFTSYIYVPAVLGMYNYICTPHAGSGMIGSFNVVSCLRPEFPVGPTVITSICTGGMAMLNITAALADSYQWYKSNALLSGDTNATLNTDQPGVYFSIATNTCGSDTSIIHILNVLPPIVITFSGDTVAKCSGNNSIIFASGASTYEWNPAVNGSANGDSINVSPVSSITYTVIATALNGCSATTTLSIDVNPSITSVAISSVSPTCGISNGTINIDTVIGGTLPFQFNLNNLGFSDTTFYHDLSAGIYSLDVTDINGCSINTSITMANALGPTAIDITSTASTCGQSGDGTITLGTVTGGTAPYQYNFNNLGFSDSTHYSNLVPNMYFIVVKDSNNCLLPNAALVDSTPAPVASFIVSNVGSTFTFTNTSTAASGYIWDFGDGSISSSNPSPTYTYSTSGTKTVVLIAGSSFTCYSSAATTIDVNTGIHSVEGNNLFNISPNPATDKLIIHPAFKVNEKSEIEIFDAAGRTIYRSAFVTSKNENSIDIHSFANGIYMIRISANDKIATAHFIKN